MSQNLADFDKMLDTSAPVQEGSGAGFCKIKVSYGYQSYSSGITDPNASWFPLKLGDADDSARAKNEADAYAAINPGKNGGKAAVSFAVRVIFFKDTVKGKVVTWAKDRVQNISRFKVDMADGTKDTALDRIWKNQANAAGCFLAGEYWVKYTYVPDPTGKMNGDRPELIWMPVEVFANEAACEAAAIAHYANAGAAGGGNHAAGGEAVPVGYTSEIWMQTKPMLTTDIQSGKPLPVIANNYGLALDFLQTFAATITAA